jgi:hypothetical protein
MWSYFLSYKWSAHASTTRHWDGQSPGQRHDPTPNGTLERTYTIFEGNSEIQRLVVARAISGVHIP